MAQSFIDLEEKIIKKGLCTACGACKGICPKNAIEYADKENACIPTLVGNCVSCGMCNNSCVAGGFDVSKLLESHHEICGEKKEDSNHSYFLCHSNKRLIWQAGASGGVVTSLLLYLLNSGEIKYAAVVSSDDKRPWLPKVKLVHDEEEIIFASQSKYCVVPTLEILSEIKSIDDPIAMVLLPCQAQAFANIRKQYPNMFSNVVYVIGLMCGNSLPFDATKDVLNEIGIEDFSTIRSLKYREGLFHGQLHVCLNDDTEKSMKYVDYMRYMADFYRKDRCKLCIDGDSWFSDISCGDGWLLENKKEDVFGWNIAHTHTLKGEEVLKEAINSGWIYAKGISETDALRQKHMYKRYLSSLPRIKNRERDGKPVPVYTNLPFRYQPSRMVLFKKRCVDKVNHILFSTTMRRLLSPISIRNKSKFLEFIMKIWFGEK